MYALLLCLITVCLLLPKNTRWQQFCSSNNSWQLLIWSGCVTAVSETSLYCSPSIPTETSLYCFSYSDSDKFTVLLKSILLLLLLLRHCSPTPTETIMCCFWLLLLLLLPLNHSLPAVVAEERRETRQRKKTKNTVQ